MELAGMSFSFSELMAGFIFGVVGFALFRAAKKDTHFPNMGVGIAMMVYPLFVHGAWLVWGVGFGLCGAAYWLHQNHIP